MLRTDSHPHPFSHHMRGLHQGYIATLPGDKDRFHPSQGKKHATRPHQGCDTTLPGDKSRFQPSQGKKQSIGGPARAGLSTIIMPAGLSCSVYLSRETEHQTPPRGQGQTSTLSGEEVDHPPPPGLYHNPPRGRDTALGGQPRPVSAFIIPAGLPCSVTSRGKLSTNGARICRE